MPKLKITAPDGEILRVDLLPEDKPEQYDAIAEEVLSDYERSKVETPGTIKSAALGAMSGIPGAQTVVDAATALGDKTFEEARKETEIQKDKAWEEHPVAYGAGKTAGIVGTGLAIPGSLSTTVPRAIGTGAVVGALSGADVSEKPADMVEDVAKGAVMGGALGGATKGLIEPAINTVVNKVAPAVGKRAVAAMGEPSLESVESYLKNPERIRQGLSQPQIAENIAGRAADLGKASGHLSEAARSELRPGMAALQMDDILPIFDQAQQKYLTSGIPVTSLDESALKVINNEFDHLTSLAAKNNGIIPEPELRAVIDKLQTMAKFNEAGNVGTSLPQKVAGDIQFRLKQILEQKNPAYAEAMKPAAEAAALGTKLQDAFGIEGGRATDKTVRQVSGLLNEPKIEEQDLARKLQEATGMDLLDMVKASKQRSEFESGGMGAAMKALFSTLGFGAGKMAGIPGMGIAGAGAGRFMGSEFRGASMAKSILDAYINKSTQWKNSAVKAAVDKYGPILANAAKQGGNKLAATHFVLATSDPEYQALEAEMNQP